MVSTTPTRVSLQNAAAKNVDQATVDKIKEAIAAAQVKAKETNAAASVVIDVEP